MNCIVVWTQLQCGEAVRSQTEVQWQAVVNAVMLLDWLSSLMLKKDIAVCS